MSRLISTAALALADIFLIAGCTTVGPDFEKPEAPRAYLHSEQPSLKIVYGKENQHGISKF
jgi:hypothetical protein